MVIGLLNPIQIATWFGYEKAVKRMISNYDDPNAPNSKGVTPQSKLLPLKDIWKYFNYC